MTDHLLELIIGDFLERPLPSLTPRNVSLPALPGKVDAVIGMRRTGKSYRLFQAMKELIDSGLPKERLLYINFEDERLYPFETGSLSRVPVVFYRIFPQNKSFRCHFFFDEIQNIPGWELFIRRLLDQENVQITISGSSARLLSREIASSLRGRSLATEIFPFSFREVLRYEGVDDLSLSHVSGARRALLSNRLGSYLRRGGFPEVQSLDDALSVRVLQEYVDVVILRDVVERHRIGNLVPLRRLIRHLLSNPAANFTVNRFYNDLKSQGIPVGKDTLHEFLSWLEESYLIQTVPIDSRSVRTQQVNPRKVYPIDPGLSLAFRHASGLDRGHLLETLVFLDLRRRGQSIAYYRSGEGVEVDFLVSDSRGEMEAIQVCETLSDPSTRLREIRGLEILMEQRRVSILTLVTLDEEDTVETRGGPVAVVPAWRWLLRP